MIRCGSKLRFEIEPEKQNNRRAEEDPIPPVRPPRPDSVALHGDTYLEEPQGLGWYYQPTLNDTTVIRPPGHPQRDWRRMAMLRSAFYADRWRRRALRAAEAPPPRPRSL